MHPNIGTLPQVDHSVFNPLDTLHISGDVLSKIEAFLISYQSESKTSFNHERGNVRLWCRYYLLVLVQCLYCGYNAQVLITCITTDTIRGAYGKAGNRNEMETEMETGNGNWKWKWEQKMHQSLVQCFLHSVLSHYCCILLSSGYRTGFMSPVLCHYSYTVLSDYTAFMS